MHGHSLYIALLIVTALLITLGAGVYGADYYLTPLQDRPFHPKYELLKPTGFLGQGYGVVGTTMIIVGVGLYSAHKRIRWLAWLGKAKHLLEFHIFLCLTGAVLVVYHTTFKFGGLVSISFWSMVAVVLSGIVGRYLYVQIPRGIHGNELTMTEVGAVLGKLGRRLEQELGVHPDLLRMIDLAAGPLRPTQKLSTVGAIRHSLATTLMRRHLIAALARELRKRHLAPAVRRRVIAMARMRYVLARRIAVLEKLRTVFYHWHVIHMPFTIIMAVILAIHVGVAIAFGYTWVF